MEHDINAMGQPVGKPLDMRFPRPRPARSPMPGRLTTLVPLDPVAHAAPLFAAFARDRDARNWTYLPYGPFADVAALGDWLAGVATGDDPLFHTVLDPMGRPAGLASYLRIAPELGTIEVGHIHLSPLLQRSGAASEAMALMMGRVFDTLGYRRYEWKCDALNAPSRAAALRLGFRYEGTFRKAAHYKGRNRDTAWFAITDDDWPRIREAFERWLDPENFDADGQQRRPLAARAPE